MKPFTGNYFFAGWPKRGLVGAFTALFLLIPALASTQNSPPVAERPVYSEGDYWTLINKNRFKERTHTFLREEEDKYVFSLNGSDKTSRFYFTSQIKSTHVGYPGPVIQFPLQIGEKWNYDYQRKGTAGGGRRNMIRAQHNVVAYEAVTVPAGTFQAFKINVHVEAVQWDKMMTMPGKMYFWYAPDVKQLIKRINMNGDTWELKEYKIK